VNEASSPESESPSSEPPFESAESDVQASEASAVVERAETSEDFVYLADVPDPRACVQDSALLAAAELLAHPQAQTPISIGLLGAPGSGKTSSLTFLVEAASQRAQAAGAALAPVWIDAGEAGDEPETLVAAHIYDALTASPQANGRLGSLAREAVASLRDVHAVAREAADRLAEMRQSLETERSSLESVAGRRARLAETVLFETPGSRVDSYARAHRAKIEARLRSFGFEGDLLAVWKELVREMAERNPFEKIGACAQTLWGYRGQGKLLAFAVLLAVLAWGFGEAGATSASWIGWMKGNGGGPIGGLANWLDAHSALFGSLQAAAVVIAILCLAIDFVRAGRFLNPIFRGAFFLKNDLDARRRDLDALLAHQTRRVDLVTREVEAQARRAEEAERLAQGPRAAISRSEELQAFYGGDQNSPHARDRFAREFVKSLERVFAREGAGAPRVLVAIDGFEALSVERAAAFMQATARLLSRPGFVAIYAVDDDRFAQAFGAEAQGRWGRIFQIPLRVAPTPDSADGRVDANAVQRNFGAPLSAAEIALLRALAPFAGSGPRDVKRFANIYRLARAAAAADASEAGALAVSILGASGALDSGSEVSQSIAEAAARAGFPLTQPALARFEPLAARFRSAPGRSS
jgi:KAP family P-loop domain